MSDQMSRAMRGSPIFRLFAMPGHLCRGFFHNCSYQFGARELRRACGSRLFTVQFVCDDDNQWFIAWTHRRWRL